MSKKKKQRLVKRPTKRKQSGLKISKKQYEGWLQPMGRAKVRRKKKQTSV